MNNEFKSKNFKDTTVYTLESATSGGTSAGGIASVSKPLGKDSIIVQSRMGPKEIPASKPRNFVAKNAKMGGAGAHKDKKKAEKQGDVKHKARELDMAEEASPMIKPPTNRFDNKHEAFAYAREHGGKVFKSTYIDPNTGNKNINFVVKKEEGVAEGAPELLKKEMPTHRYAEKLLAQNGVSKDDPDYYHHLNNTIKHLRQFGNIDLINKSDEQGVAEGSLNEFAMSGGDDDEDPFDNYPCYDCGSTIFLHHTELCELAEENAIRDLPARHGSQHWTGEIPKGLHPIPGLQEGVAEAKGKLTYTPEPTEYGVFPDSKNEFVKTFLSRDLALAHIKKFGGKLIVLDQHGRRMKEGVAEGAPELLKAEMPLVRHIERELTQHGYEKGTSEYNEHFKHALAYYRKFGNIDAIKKGVVEGFPQPGESSGKAKQFNPNAKVQTKEMTLDQILATVKGIPYVNNVVDDWDAKDYSWGVTKKVIEYAQYLQKNPQSVANLPPLVVIDGQLNDGAHRLSAINLLQKRMDPKNPLWKQVKLKVNFGTSADVAPEQGVAEGAEEDSYSNKFVQSQIDYYTKHGLSGTAADRERINGSLNYYQHIKNKRINDGTWQEQGVAEGSLNEFAMSGGDDDEDPFDNYPCYDCGSTIFLHHTELCELAEENAIRDLPAKPGSQHWTGQIPKGLHPIPGLHEGVAEEKCPHCGGELVSEDMINEKKDACYYKVKSRYKVWPSAYASGALVKCRKAGASNWGNGGKKNESSILEGIEQTDEDLHQWFKEKWVRFGPDGKIRGDCARGDDSEGKPKCLPQSKAHALGKKGRASAAARKRREDPNPERHGKAINVNTKKKTDEAANPAQQAAIAINMKKHHQKPKNEAAGDVNIDLESAYRRATEITRQIKHDDTVTQIIVQIQMLAEKAGINTQELNWAIDEIYDAKNQLERAIYGLDEVFKDALDNQQYNDEVDEDTSYSSGGGQGGNAGQSYRKFTPKSAGTFNEMDSFDNVTHYTPKMAGTFNESKLSEEPSDPVGTQPGGWRTYRAKSAGTNMKKESSIMKGLKETDSTGMGGGSAGVGGGSMVGGPTTYEQENDKFKRKGARRITAMTYEGKK